MRRLDSEQPWQAEHTANTIVKYPDLRIVLVALKIGARLHKHQAAGRISIHVLSGGIRTSLQDQAMELHSGELLALDRNLPHEVEAMGDSMFLLTIAWPSGGE